MSPTNMGTQKEWAVISITMYAYHACTNRQQGANVEECNIPVNDMNKRYTWYMYRGSK